MKTPRLLQGRRGPVLSVFLLLLIAACVAYWQLRPAAPSTPATGAAASMLEALQESTAPWQANRRDLSVLLADLRGASIASAALASIRRSRRDAKRVRSLRHTTRARLTCSAR